MCSMQRLQEKQDDLHPVMEGFAHSSLGKIIQKAKWLLTLNRTMQAILPAEFASYCHVMNVNQGVLILGVSSAAIATRIQFMSSQLTYTLQKQNEFRGIIGIQCKVCAKHVSL